MSNKLKFKFRDLEITSDSVILHFYEDKTIVPLNQIKGYHLDWHLHEPVFARKWWFLVLTLELENGSEESGPIAVTKFNYLGDDLEPRQHIERKIEDALDLAIASTATPAQKMICI
jgi:hypothetical protein